MTRSRVAPKTGKWAHLGVALCLIRVAFAEISLSPSQALRAGGEAGKLSAPAVLARGVAALGELAATGKPTKITQRSVELEWGGSSGATVCEHDPHLFSDLRRAVGVSDRQLREALAGGMHEFVSNSKGSRSGVDFFLSANKQFMVGRRRKKRAILWFVRWLMEKRLLVLDASEIR